MRLRLIYSLSVLLGALSMISSVQTPTAASEPFPPVSALKANPSLPDPLTAFDGTRIATAQQWRDSRRPELIRLFQHYMYGKPPAVPTNLKATVEFEDRRLFGGKATLRLVTLEFGPAGTPAMHLLVAIPNRRSGRVAAFVGLNFCGNHAVLDHPQIPLPTVWLPGNCPGCKDNRATDEGRGKQQDVWAIEQSIDRGYAVATCYTGDIDPDQPDFSDGVHPHFLAPGETAPGPNDWGTIAAWAWGLQRAVDYLVSAPEIDTKRIAAVGHSRLGKTALLAGATDERIALVIPHQAGCGGTAPSRHKVGESVKQINDRFPHWFCDEFTKFNDDVDRLPFDQHCLVAVCAPRPVLFTNAVEDSWADPEGQFRVLEAAAPVYKLLGVDGLGTSEYPAPGKLVNSRLGYFIREGTHSMTSGDWKVFLDFADTWMK
ncbi:MAG: acetylxylan esterase [Planctomycetaceae bacterium]|nr:MAG: acetylxylan esterase [Planctomycetaceae bacterium]